MKNKRFSALRISWISIAINLILAVAKITVGVLSNSIAIISDAIHSLSDLATTVVVILSLRVSKKPADRKHPFGHGRAQDVGGLILSIGLVLVGVGFFKTAASRLISPEPVNVNFVFVGVILISAAIKLILGAITHRISVLERSAILKADAYHHYSDFVTSFVVAIGFIFARTNVNLDSWLGIFIALIIIFWAIRSGKEFSDNLIGKRASPQVYQKVRAIAHSFETVLGVHDIQAHSYGQHRIISLHVEVDPNLSLEEAHGVADSIEKKIRYQRLGKCIVHVDIKRSIQS
ncbi:MAG: cation transporter [Candidatus Omnitrophica bacterium]|nr:cation transporter [Candidatus Omnitrophota bacterium]